MSWRRYTFEESQRYPVWKPFNVRSLMSQNRNKLCRTTEQHMEIDETVNYRSSFMLLSLYVIEETPHLRGVNGAVFKSFGSLDPINKPSFSTKTKWMTEKIQLTLICNIIGAHYQKNPSYHSVRYLIACKARGDCLLCELVTRFHFWSNVSSTLTDIDSFWHTGRPIFLAWQYLWETVTLCSRFHFK